MINHWIERFHGGKRQTGAHEMSKFSFWQKLLLIILGIITLASCFPACSKSLAGSGATVVTSLQGDVQVQKKSDSNWIKASVQMVLQPGDIIKTGADARAVVTFFEGTTIELKAGTQIAVSELTKATVQGGATTIRLKQQIGNTVNTVSKLTDSASRYEIETPSAVAGVRGSIMLVSVAQDGTTKVTNQEGHVYVNARGVEVTIPVGNSSTVQPGQPPAPPQPAANIHLDPADDTFESKGNPISGYQYLDIVNEATDYTDGTWSFTIKLNANIPSNVEAPGVVEYDVMVDADNNVKTGWQSSLLFNDLGIDYYVYFSIAGSTRKCAVIDTATSAPVNNLGVNYSTSGDTVKIWFKYDLTGASRSFNYIVLARQYSKVGDPQTLVAADKLPNQGHLTATGQ